jgi:Txe/YoeB family toxin of Txe-Axe toxin-antitoxin module
VANKDFNSIEAALKFIEQQAQSVLKQEIASKVVKTMKKHVQTDVYDKYEPVMYERQGYNGGLIDEDNIEVSVVDDDTISVENIRFDGNREVAQIVESGQGYTYDFEYNGIPRPFTENTRNELRETNALEIEMRKGLTRRGLNVK